jgi:hypothetical protein
MRRPSVHVARRGRCAGKERDESCLKRSCKRSQNCRCRETHARERPKSSRSGRGREEKAPAGVRFGTECSTNQPYCRVHRPRAMGHSGEHTSRARDTWLRCVARRGWARVAVRRRAPVESRGSVSRAGARERPLQADSAGWYCSQEYGLLEKTVVQVRWLEPPACDFAMMMDRVASAENDPGMHLASLAPAQRRTIVMSDPRPCPPGASANDGAGVVGRRSGSQRRPALESSRIDVAHSERTTANRHVSGTIRQAFL